MKGFTDLNLAVINKGLCTGCGTCVGVCPGGAIGFVDAEGEPLPVLEGKCTNCGICEQVCPGAEVNLPELEEFSFGRKRGESREEKPAHTHGDKSIGLNGCVDGEPSEKCPMGSPESLLGVFQNVYKGWALDGEIRRRGAGGGVVTALLAWALDTGYLDGVLVAGFDPDKPWRTKPYLARTAEEVRRYAQSKYAVVTTNALLLAAAKSGCERLGVVGVPCQIHALRKMQAAGVAKNIAKRVKLMIGLYCASQFYFEGTRHLVTEQARVQDMERITSLTYRGGDWPGHLVVGVENGAEVVVDRHQYMYHFLMPGYKRDRCEMCVDWAAELADVSVGDFWAPEAGSKSSSFLVRSEIGREVMDKAQQAGAIECEAINPEVLYSGIGFELKKHAAAFRLRQRQRFNWPTPNYHLTVDSSPFPREIHLAKESKK